MNKLDFSICVTWDTARWASTAAASHSAMAFSDSSFGNTSMPLRKGISASWHFPSSSSTFATLSRPVLRDVCIEMACRWGFNLAWTASIFERNSRPSLFKASNLDRFTVSALLDRTAMTAIAEVKFVDAGPNTLSTSASSPSDMFPASSALHKLAALSISGERLSSFPEISASAFCVATNMGNSFLNALYGVSFICVSSSLDCSALNSFIAFDLASPEYIRQALMLKRTSWRTSATFFNTPSADASTVMSCLFSAVASSGAFVIRGAATLITFSASASTFSTSAFVLERATLKSLASCSSFCFCFTSSSFFF
mmetsp:Transcript_63574/g.176828  ORF Transcript_63574/g.176828 Transcript_63574/m.176828 type:complete len:312 (+) Transcript_63574:559-1494(+)